MQLYRINDNEYINIDELLTIGIYNAQTAVNNKTGWTLEAVFEGIGGRYAKVIGTYGTKAEAQAAFDTFASVVSEKAYDYPVLTYTAVTNDNESVRAGNTAKIASVKIDGSDIIITLSCKVSALADFDARGGWGVHKWLGIGLSGGTESIKSLTYNGAALTDDDVTEATNVGLSAGYFVRWVAADLVLAGDDTQASKGSFVLGAGAVPRRYRLVIKESN